MYTVNGKRKSRSSEITSNNSRQSKRGRPSKIARDLTIFHPSGIRQSREQEVKPPDAEIMAAPWLSQLEALPTELIYQIFFLCLETNLPKASPRIARALSTESTYKTLILFAYFDDDNKHPVETKWFRPVAYRPISARDKVSLQRGIVSYRWYTLERIKACLPALSRLSMVQAWYAEQEAEQRQIREADAGLDIHNTISLSTNNILRKLAAIPKIQSEQMMEKHFFAKTELRYGRDGFTDTTSGLNHFETYLPRIATWSSTLGNTSNNNGISIYKTINNRTSVLAARVLPNWLVMGNPWTQGKLELLQLLRQGLQFIRRDFFLEISAPAVLEGMANAIKEQNVEALLTLLELHNDVFEKQSPIDESCLVPPSNYPLPVELFHLATQAGSKSSQMLWLLARAGIDSISKDDAILTGWALQAQTDGDNVAKWLLQHMSGTIEYDIGRRGHLFVHGSLSWRASQGVLPPAEQRFSQELNYLEGGRTFLPTNLDRSPCG